MKEGRDRVFDQDAPQGLPTDPSEWETLSGWWARIAEEDLDRLMPKVSEYGSLDLILMGHFMELWLGTPPGSGQEMACMFYALGKVARAVAAYKDGGVPSEDTLMDLEVYAKMARRIRERGQWP